MNPLSPQKIENLVSALKEGSEDAFTELFQFFSPKIINTARKFGIPQEESEEMTQEIFLFIWKNRTNLKTELSFNAYLLTILKSKVYQRAKAEMKKLAYQKYALKHLELISNGTENQVNYEELVEISNASIAKLPEQQRQVFLMRNVSKKSSKEISEQLGLSKRTVENHFYIATKTIKNEIQKRYRLPLDIIGSAGGFLFLFLTVL